MKKYFPDLFKFIKEKEYKDFFDTHKPRKIIDIYDQLNFEKFINSHPSIYFSSPDKQQSDFILYKSNLNGNKPECTLGTWIYHPWNRTLIHLLDQDDYVKLRTIRNKNLISDSEQNILYNKKIAFAGLSVGLNIISAFVRMGIGNYFKIADYDRVMLSNINRSFYDIHTLGKYKYEVARDTIFGIDPYLNVKIFPEGINKHSLKNFLHGTDLIVDAFDNFNLKIELRKEAKRKKIPVLSGFDVEYGILIIVERYDRDPGLDMNFFLNHNNEKDIASPNLSVLDKTNSFINIIGREYHSERMLESVLSVGTSLTGYPQLIIASSLAASIFTYIAKSLFSVDTVSSYRKFISISDLLTLNH